MKAFSSAANFPEVGVPAWRSGHRADPRFEL